jgi:hypothetical protein
MGIEINAVVDLAAALANKGESHAIEESQAAADIGGGFTSSEVSRRRRGQRISSDGGGKGWTRCK